MKPEEVYAEDYLKKLGVGAVEYEPIPNETPDFLVNGRIAVEVRRLNENLPPKAGGKLQGLEQADIPLGQRVRALLKTYGAPVTTSGVVSYRFARPVDWKAIEPRMRAELDQFQDGPAQKAIHRQLSPSFWFSIYPVSMPLPDRFRLHVTGDEDSGGMLIELIKRNLELVVPEKEAKISKNRHLYPTWWLLLVDTIGLGDDPDEQAALRSAFTYKHSFDKIIIVGPSGGFELTGASG
jgi:hypothetical protein